ncbi:MSCRAMM family adhesin [Nocardiopsis deserti]|uniref:hypothetical protein n=1 Tax=Nocardiopsis deserti TaxID=2605988 RepID=UPI00123A95B1|nr:hypothetical protein [Nocardiopsis deserti]
MSDGLINPDAIPIPAANTWELESAAAGMKSDGGDISQAGHDIKSTWAGLQSVYSAPESETLFAAVDPVSTKGDDAETALNTAAQALETFAETAQRIRGELFAAQGEARQLLADIEGDEDWNSGEHPFDFESEKGQEHDALLSLINGLVHEYQEAERTCANAITGTFGGTTFIAGDAEGTTQPGADEMVYGFDEPLENVATPWGTPQGIDHFWTVDAALAAWDVVRGSVEDVGGAVGAYGEPGWFTGDWGDNFDAYWGDVLAGMGAAAGVWNPETQDWTNSFGEGVQVSTDAGLSALHGFFPWTELEERPGYAWGTLGTNAAFIVGGVALSMTGVGAVVGVPMAASRLTRIFGGIGSGEGVPGGGEGSGGYDGSEGNGNGGNRPRSEGSGSQSPQALEEGGISADDHYESSGIGGMNESLSELENSQTQGPPTTSSEEPAPTPTPERSPEPSHQPDAEKPAPSLESDTDSDAPEQRPEQNEQRDPTAQEVDEAFAELARNNDDLANDTDSVDDGRAPVFSDDDLWAMSPLEDSGSNGGAGADSRIPVASSGAELRADGTFDNSANPSSGAQGDSDPVTVHEDQRPATGDSRSGGPPEPPRPPGPPGPSFPDPSEGKTPDAQYPEESQSLTQGDGETDPDILNSRPGDGYYLGTGEFVDVGHRDASGAYVDEFGDRFIDVPQSPEAANTYRRVINSTESTQEIHQSTGYNLDVLNQVKEHLFLREHTNVATPPTGETLNGKFAPVNHIAEFWELAESGDINLPEKSQEADKFHRLLIHEYVESRLMEAGIPYRAHGPEMWDEGVYFPNPDQHGAHDIAPHEHNQDIFIVWRRYGIPEPDFEIADDLSNIDDIVDIVIGFKGLK